MASGRDRVKCERKEGVSDMCSAVILHTAHQAGQQQVPNIQHYDSTFDSTVKKLLEYKICIIIY